MSAFHRITVIKLMGYTIRVQERTQGIEMGPNHAITVGLRAAVRGDSGSLLVTPESIAEVMIAMKVEAYEILDSVGNGCVVCRDWP